MVALAEYQELSSTAHVFRIHRVLKGENHLPNRERLAIAASWDSRPGTLALVLGGSGATSGTGQLQFSAMPLNEASYAYVAAAPELRLPPRERLPYFARYLEHADAWIADDAYQEMAHATYHDIVEITDAFSVERLTRWLQDERVPEERKGFYALAVGVAGAAADREADRTAAAQLVRRLTTEAADDFRAGFDGILAALMLLEPQPALDLIVEQYLANPAARDGDVRHAMSALRFYYEYGTGIPRQELAAAMRHLLARGDFAAAAVVDLARWQDWDSLKRVVSLFDKPNYPQPATSRAVVGYLFACPRDEAQRELARLRQLDPQRVTDAERHIALTGGSL